MARFSLGVVAIATVVAPPLSGCAVAVVGSPPTATPVPTATATLDMPTFEGIEASWQTSDTLGRTHLSSSKEHITCDSCHGNVPPGEVNRPKDTFCLTCHGGSLEAAIDLMADQDPNPHSPEHLGQTSCTFCHLMHKPYRDPCSFCH